MKNNLITVATLLVFTFAPIFVVSAQRPQFPPGQEVRSYKVDSPDEDDSQDAEDDEDGEDLYLRPQNNKIKVRTVSRNENRNQNAFEEKEVEEVEIELEDEDATQEGEPVRVKAKNNKSQVIRNKVVAQTNFPLRVNLDTNELIVSTPKGEKIVTTLPDAAVQNMLAANVLDQIGGKGGLLWLEDQEAASTATESAAPTATDSGEPEEATEEGEATPSASPAAEEEPAIELTTTDDGELAYKIRGAKNEKFLGMFKVKLNRTVYVSAEDGQLLDIEQTFFTDLLDALSL